MAFLETKTIKAPTLYSTDNEAATQFKTDMEAIKTERDRLVQEQSTVEARVSENEIELQKLQSELKRTTEPSKRVEIKASIQERIAERENLFDVMGLDIPSIVAAKMIELGVLGSQEQAAAEHARWFEEINDYYKAIDNLYRETKRTIANIRDYNIYKTTTTVLDNMEKFIKK